MRGPLLAETSLIRATTNSRYAGVAGAMRDDQGMHPAVGPALDPTETGGGSWLQQVAQRAPSPLVDASAAITDLAFVPPVAAEGGAGATAAPLTPTKRKLSATFIAEDDEAEEPRPRSAPVARATVALEASAPASDQPNALDLAPAPAEAPAAAGSTSSPPEARPSFLDLAPSCEDAETLKGDENDECRGELGRSHSPATSPDGRSSSCGRGSGKRGDEDAPDGLLGPGTWKRSLGSRRCTCAPAHACPARPYGPLS